MMKRIAWHYCKLYFMFRSSSTINMYFCISLYSSLLLLPHTSMFANNALLGGEVRVRVWIREQRSKEDQRLLMANLDITHIIVYYTTT